MKSPIERMIDAAVRCAKCGAAGIGNCRCWIWMECPRYGKKKIAERHEIDPPTAVRIVAHCGCAKGVRTVRYFAADGSQVFP